jgi:uncharacterized protein YcfL
MKFDYNVLKNNRLLKLLKRPASIVTMVLASTVIAACDSLPDNVSNPQQSLTDNNELAEVETVTSLEEVAEEGNQLIGQTVTISGEVEEVLSPDSLVLEDEENLFFEDKVLVLSVNNLQNELVLQEGENAQITGEVAQLVVAEFEREYDLTWDLELKQKLEVEYEGKPVVIGQITRVQ